MNKAIGLRHIDVSMKITVQKCIVDVELLQRLMLDDCNGKDCADGSGLHNRTEHLEEINTSFLMEALGYLTSFAMLNTAI